VSTRTNRIRRRALIVFGAIAALIVAIGGLPSFLWATARPLHPDPQDVPSAVQSQPAPQWVAAVNRARQIVRAVLSEQNLPGLSVAVGVGSDIVWAEGFGWADVEAHAPVTPQTRFRMGTASTALTAAAVGVLLEQDRVALDEEIQAYVPQFPKQQWPVTLRQLMGNVSGVGIADTDDWRLSSERCERAADALPVLADSSLLFQPGTQFRPSPRGWVLVSAAVEAAAGRPFLSFMRDQIFEPLDMANTGAEPPQEENPEHLGEDAEDPPPFRAIHDVILEPWRVVAGAQGKSAAAPRTSPAPYYAPQFGPHPVYRYGLRVAGLRNLSCYAGSMAFFSTPSDLVRFELGMRGSRLLRPATVQSLEAFGRTAGGYDGELVGVRGVFDSELPDVTIMSVMTVREPGIVVVTMSNSTSADTSALARTVGDAFTGSLTAAHR
jgi:CubicO group peptidase (beta-lactamase class C family)